MCIELEHFHHLVVVILEAICDSGHVHVMNISAAAYTDNISNLKKLSGRKTVVMGLGRAEVYL